MSKANGNNFLKFNWHQLRSWYSEMSIIDRKIRVKNSLTRIFEIANTFKF